MTFPSTKSRRSPATATALPAQSRQATAGQEVRLEATPTDAPGLAVAKSLEPGPPFQVYHRESGCVLVAAAETIERGQAIVSRIKDLVDWDDAMPVQLMSQEERESVKAAVFLAAEETKQA